MPLGRLIQPNQRPYSRLRGAVLCLLLALPVYGLGSGFKPVYGLTGSPFRGTVWGLAKDEFGFLWIGADEGLYRYDGYQIKPSRLLADLQRLKGEQIRVLQADLRGSLWLGSREGLFRLNLISGDVHSYRNLSDSLGFDHRIASLEPAAQGGVWVGSRSGLQYFKSVDHFIDIPLWESDPGLDGKHVRALLQEPSGLLWVGTNDGLFSWDPASGEKKHYRHDPAQANGLTGNLVRALCLDAAGRLWVGTTNGLFMFGKDKANFQPITHSDGSDVRGINVLRHQPSGMIWIGSRAGGIEVYDPMLKRFTQYGAQAGLPTQNIIELLLDKHGLVWAGGFKAGLAMMDLKPAKFEDITLPQTLRSGEIRALTMDRKGWAWGASQYDLFSHNTKTGEFRSFKAGSEEEPFTGRISMLRVDGSGRIWALGDTGEVFIHDPAKPGDPSFPAVRFSGPGMITALAASSGERMWLGARNGLFPVEATGVAGEPLLPDRNLSVRVIHEAGNGDLWVGSGYGAIRIPEGGRDFQHLRPIDDTNAISHHIINDIKDDLRGHIWIATYQGLNRFDPVSNTVRIFLDRDGLPDAAIRALIPGRGGEIWLSTSAGLVRFEPESGAVRIFDRSDGIWASVFTQHSVTQLPAGDIYFGGVNRYYRFHPLQMFENPYPPSAAVTAFEIFGRETSLADKRDASGVVTLTRDENFFSIQFAALEFTNPLKNRYAYKLEGFDEDWIQSGTRRFAGYTNVPGGDYTFLVKGSNSDGLWDEEGFALPIRIIPAIWEQWWFKSLLFLLLVVPFGIGRQMYFSGMIRRRNELEAVAEVRTADLKETRHQLLDEARKAGMAEITTGVLHNVGNILNSIAVSATQIMRTLNESKVEKLHMACDLLRNIDPADHPYFLSKDPKGRLLPQFLVNVNRALDHEERHFENEAQLMLQRIALMSRAVVLEQSYGSRYGALQEIRLHELVEEALDLQDISIRKRDIHVVRRFKEAPSCRVNNYNLTHVVIKLIRNAVESLTSEPRDAERRILTITIQSIDADFNLIEIADNGLSLSEEELANLFSYGYTNRQVGGFGLQSCRNAMIETGGSLEVAAGLHGGCVYQVRVPLMQRDTGGDDAPA